MPMIEINDELLQRLDFERHSHEAEEPAHVIARALEGWAAWAEFAVEIAGHFGVTPADCASGGHLRALTLQRLRESQASRMWSELPANIDRVGRVPFDPDHEYDEAERDAIAHEPMSCWHRLRHPQEFTFE